MNRACAGKDTQTPVRSFGCPPVLPPHPRRVTARDYEREPAQHHHETGRLFCRQERSGPWQPDRTNLMCRSLRSYILPLLLWPLARDNTAGSSSRMSGPVFWSNSLHPQQRARPAWPACRAAKVWQCLVSWILGRKRSG